MSIEVIDLSRGSESEFQYVESYLFIRRGQDATDRILMTTPRLDQNRDTLNGRRPISILYSKISNDERQWEIRIMPYLVSDGIDARLELVRSTNFQADKSNKHYQKDMEICLEILGFALSEFKQRNYLTSINLENVVHAFQRETNAKPT